MVRFFQSEKLIAVISAVLVLILSPTTLSAWNRTEIRWKSIETEHFSVHFHEGEEWSAREIARIAEEIYGPVTAFYDYELDRVHINLHDNDDKSSGAAYFYLNRIDLDASDYEFHLRGTADWLRNVLTHEFTHMVTIRLAMKMPRWLPSIYLQGITFETEKRPDVITGYPNFQGSLPIAGEVLPNWFAEGVAQFQCPTSRNDIWDTHRDMLLRIAVLEDTLLSMDEMGVFGKNSLESELVYNQGYSLVKFISREFGRESLNRLLKAHRTWYRMGFGGACKEALGISSSDLYTRWKESLEDAYTPVMKRIGERTIEGTRFAGEGYMNLFPVTSGAEDKVYYLSNMGRDYMGMDLVALEPDGTTRVISDGVNSRPGISKDGRRLCYAKRSDDNPHGYEINDIFIFDLDTEKEERITRGLRVVDPEFSPDGKSIAAVRTGDGKEDVVIVELASCSDDCKVRILVSGDSGYRYHGLSWNDRGILTSRFDGTSRDILLIDLSSGMDTVLVGQLADERDPAWDESGTGFFFASDRTGIFNIYHRETCHGIDKMVTNLVGGAFSPVSHGEGMLFSSYDRDGYQLRKIVDWRDRALTGREIPEDSEMMEKRSDYICRIRTADGTGVMYDYDELDKKISEAQDYDIKYTPVYLFPRLMYYDKKPRIGLTLDTRDYLDRQSFYASGSINDDKEYNIQLGIETRQFKPTFAVNFYSARKYYKYFEEALGNVQVRYDLWDAFFSCRLEFDEPSARKRKDAVIQYNRGEYGLNINAWEAEDIDMELGWKYYKANEVSLILNYWDIASGVDSDINPQRGRRISLELTRAWNNLSSGEFEYNFKPLYNENDFGRYYLHYEEYFPLPLWSHSLSLFVKGGMIDKKEVDDFFDLFLGSRDGMRGYSYYSMGGKKNAMARLTYRFPIWRNINTQLMSTYFGSLYGAVFAEAGKAWDEDEFDLDHNMKDAGFEIRMKGFSFYHYPLAISFEGAYGFNEIKYVDPFIEGRTTYEGKEWKYYGTVFFDF